MKNARNRFRSLLSRLPLNPTVISLLSANLITIVLAIAQNWDAASVIFIYWVQSIIIGIFSFIAILGADTSAIRDDLNEILRRKGEKGTVNLQSVRTHTSFLAVIFCFHYGIFLLAYYSIIIESCIFGPVDFYSPGIWFSCGLFFVNHIYSYMFYRKRVRQDNDFVTESFITPYARVVPMHLIILFGGFVIVVLQIFGIESTLPVLVVFLLLKTITDLVMHIRKHPEDF